MAHYVDGFVLPLHTRNRKKYLAMARLAGKVWREHGALYYVEAFTDDVKPGKVTSFPQSVKLKKGEKVVFSFAIYKSRRHRDAVLKKVLTDPRLAEMMDLKKMPFDAKRMIYGGFKMVVEL